MSLLHAADDVSDNTPMLDQDGENIVLLPNESPRPVSRAIRIKNGITMFVLFMINLLNFMDRYSIPGVLEKIQNYFDIGNSEAGLLQTVFICSYMALAPLFGYLGDRYSRKLMIILGVILWSLTTVAGSFVPKNQFWLFLTLRCLVGIGEASYSCVAPTIIADMYKDNTRTRMLALFNIAVPLGSGLGYILGSEVSKAFESIQPDKKDESWRWALRVTPVLGVVCVVLLIALVREPERGGVEGSQIRKSSSWFFDVTQILKVKSFILTTLGFTWVSFALGSLSWWGPIFLEMGHVLASGSDDPDEKKYVSLIFGIITAAAGIVGVLLGSEVANRYRQINSRGDPVVCGSAVILAMPFLFLTFIFSKDQLIITWVLAFFGETLLCSTWALITDMLMYIMIPTRRATASSIQIFVLHLFGDASSPYIIGSISDFLLKDNDDNLSKWLALRNALMLTPFVATLGGAAFLISSFYILDDRHRAEKQTAQSRISNDMGLSKRAY